ncbi:Response regulator [hydrothermal vent metagenome]|uniref:Response regulator n=1 Tax=hydrothermal vent metagenome TaxID=652676 RepID=A0A3B1B7T1_9ZZZZ
MQKRSLKRITLNNLIAFLMLLSLAILIVLSVNIRAISISVMEDKALAIADVVKAGITSHMRAGTMDKRDYFLTEINSLTLVDEIAIIRSQEVINQFGVGMQQLERQVDQGAEEAFKTRQPVYIIDDIQLKPYMRAIVPFIASREGGLNCLECHKVKERTVLGVLDMRLDLAGYRNATLTLLTSIGFITAFFIALIIVNNFRTIQRYVQEPLERLMQNSTDAYQKKQPINTDAFECLEFETVAEEINLFTKDVLHHQEIIEKKNVELAEMSSEIEDSLRESIFTMGVIEEQRSKEASNHTLRVTKYSQLLGIQYGLSEYEVEMLTIAAPLHDIGKLGIPDAVLLKPAKLTAEEFEVVKSHCIIGHNMLSHSKRETLRAAAIIAYQHHEKWDGTGYPQGLKGNNIHTFGRIVALADVFDALFAKRIYKDEWALDEVLSYLKEERGRQFDPQLVDVLLQNAEAFAQIRSQYT